MRLWLVSLKLEASLALVTALSLLTIYQHTKGVRGEALWSWKPCNWKLNGYGQQVSNGSNLARGTWPKTFGDTDRSVTLAVGVMGGARAALYSDVMMNYICDVKRKRNSAARGPGRLYVAWLGVVMMYALLNTCLTTGRLLLLLLLLLRLATEAEVGRDAQQFIIILSVSARSSPKWPIMCRVGR